MGGGKLFKDFFCGRRVYKNKQIVIVELDNLECSKWDVVVGVC